MIVKCFNCGKNTNDYLCPSCRTQEILDKNIYAREALHDDYYAANHFCPGIILEFSDICKQGDEAILAKALEKGLI